MSRKLLQKNFCVIPWTGFELEPDGKVKNCIISEDTLGSIYEDDIENIVAKNPVRQQMLDGLYPKTCNGCYFQERHRPESYESISSRLYYAKHLANRIHPKLLEDSQNFDLRHVDLRWSNSCNQACVYCGPRFSSKWENELGVKIKKDRDNTNKVKKYVYDRIENLDNVYLAGGEPLLMKQNKEFIDLLYEKNPNATLRVNTNLSRTNTGIFETICKFKDVHWTVSIETIEQEYEYVRYHGNWNHFLENLENISKLGHRITFNMLYFILNYNSIFDCIDFLKSKNFHNNSFVIGPLFEPPYLSIMNLPTNMLEKCKERLQTEIDKKPGFLLQNSLENCLSYLTEAKFHANIELTKKELILMDKRRNIDSSKIFTQLYKEAF